LITRSTRDASSVCVDIVEALWRRIMIFI
jgi:hypothetical protein